MKVDQLFNEYRLGDADKRMGLCLYYREFRDEFSRIVLGSRTVFLLAASSTLVSLVIGTFVGVLIMGLLRNGLNLMDVSAFWQMVVIGVVIILAVYVDVLRQRVPQQQR